MNRRTFFRDVLASAALAWGAPLVAMAEVAPEAEPVVDRMLTDADIYKALPRFGIKGSNLIGSANPMTVEEIEADLRDALRRFASAIEVAQ